MSQNPCKIERSNYTQFRMNVFYEEDGSFKVAAVMSEQSGSLQVESISGKRSKVKLANVLLRFENPIVNFMEEANSEARNLDVPFLWECSGEDEFGFEDLAKEYYGKSPSPIQSSAVLITLHSAPVYFYRKGKGHYKAAPEETLKAALAAIEKKRIQAEKVAGFVEALRNHQLPEELRLKLDMLMYEPDKNSMEWKALDQAAMEMNESPIRILAQTGAISSFHDYHLGAFLREYFPKGTDFPDCEFEFNFHDLPVSSAEAFSIDDSTTTEIDDALSVQSGADGHVRVGIHIAVPAMGIQPGSDLDRIAMHRLSTVYMPGNKITMLPESVVSPFSLNEGGMKPVLSLYLEVGDDFTIVRRETRLEMVNIVANLRHDSLEPYFNENTLSEDNGHPYWEKLIFLFNLAEALEKARGKYDPTRPAQIDYNFYVVDGKVSIVPRRRGSPMDKLVAELMIEANSQWGLMLAENKIPGIYRAQNGGKVYMTSQAEPHQGLGVAQYAWHTSPLRRAVDLINQRQILSILRHERPAYPEGSDELKTHMRNFELAYNAYNEFQSRMERYWCLQYLIQENITEIGATLWRENLVRLDGIPIITKITNLPELPSGKHLVVDIKEIDTLQLEINCKFKSFDETVTEDTSV